MIKAGPDDFRMLYTGVETLEGETIERGCYATSTDGKNWTRQGVALNPSQVPFADDEVGVEPTGMLIDENAPRHAPRLLQRRRPHRPHPRRPCDTAFPTPPQPVCGIPNGWATYQLGDETTSARDFRSIARASSGRRSHPLDELRAALLDRWCG